MAEREDGSSVWIPQSRLYKLAPVSIAKIFITHLI